MEHGLRLLILSSYFTPDLSAGSFRMQGFVDALEAWRDKGLEVDLITTRPNRYASLKLDAPPFEDRGWLRIHRIELTSHRSGMGDQARAYVGYALGVRKLTRGKRWDLVFATSSRLMTAGLGAQVARRLGAPLYLDIRDLFTENMDELLAASPLRMLLPVFRRVERHAFRSAKQINVVSEGFVPTVIAIAPGKPISCFTNGIDDIFTAEDFTPQRKSGHLPLIVYAGNMGEGQGLHRIVPEAAKALSGRARFRLIGDGAKRKELEAIVKSNNVSNVELLPAVSRSELMSHYREADILFMHLNGLRAFQKVLPSKLFEYAAIGRPILAGVSGHAADFLTRHLPDAEVFEPLDANSMAAAVVRLLDTPQSSVERTAFLERFSRKAIMRRMAEELMTLV